ncbi:MAG: hypothetical protein ACOY40_09630 [Bacillota bacterium]
MVKVAQGNYNKEDIQQKYNKMARQYALQDPFQEFLLGVRKLRRKLLQRTYGNVLEVAIGTGVNLPYRYFFGIFHLIEALSSESKINRMHCVIYVQ